MKNVTVEFEVRSFVVRWWSGSPRDLAGACYFPTLTEAQEFAAALKELK